MAGRKEPKSKKRKKVEVRDIAAKKDAKGGVAHSQPMESLSINF